MALKNIIYLLAIATILFSCEDNIQFPDPEEIYTCCGENPFSGSNVNNLPQDGTENISVTPMVTANNDGFNDYLFFENLEFHLNNSITIYNSSNQIIHQSNAYGNNNTDSLFPYDELNGSNPIPAAGVYRYKLIIENEGIFIEEGYFCMFDGNANDLSSAECLQYGFDPIVDGN